LSAVGVLLPHGRAAEAAVKSDGAEHHVIGASTASITHSPNLSPAPSEPPQTPRVTSRAFIDATFPMDELFQHLGI
jgi:hypothetical protein